MARKKDQPAPAASKDNPRILERVTDGAKARTTDQIEYLSMTTGMGYRDITSGSGSKSSGGSSNTGTGSGTTGTVGSGGAASKAGDA